MISNQIPGEITSGDDVSWTETAAEYPAPAFRLQYVAVNSNQRLQFASVADGEAHRFEITGANSSDFLPGEYRWQRQAVEVATSKRLTLSSGPLTIHPNFDEYGEGLDARHWTEIALENIEAVLADTATAQQSSYSIAGRSLSRRSVDELIALRAYCNDELAKERRRRRMKRGGKAGRRVVMRFPSGSI